MIQSIAFLLVEWTIRATVLAGAVGVLLWVLRIKDTHARLTAWTIVLVAVLLMPLAAWSVPHLSIPLPRLWGQQANQPLPQSFALPFQALGPRHTEFQQIGRDSVWATVAVGAWLLVALAMLLRLAIGLLLSYRLVRGSQPVEAGIRESDKVRVPVTVGIIRPAVVLPADWRQWPELKLSAVLAHERSHVARRDPLRQFAASIYRCVAWFHPLAWWLRAKLAELAEEASDDIAIAAGQDRVKYAEMLLNFIERAPRRVEWEGVSMANRRTRMLRIDRVLDQTRSLSRPSGNTAAALILAALPLIYASIATHPVWAQAPAAATPVETLNPKACGGNRAYAKWVTEDVAYILPPAERQALDRLTSESECGEFVAQFWQRRDPTPGTSRNEFKEEHYRRMAFANQHFASDRTPGWQTDRGRVYILYGPPDEIESHPSGEQAHPDPFEQWLYHHVDPQSRVILFEFVDAKRDKEYRLTFLGGPSDNRELRGPVVFGPISGLYVQVNRDRTLHITAQVGRTETPLYGKIVDRAGALVEAFEDVTRGAMYGKAIATPLPAGRYTLHLQVGPEDRSLVFDVK